MLSCIFSSISLEILSDISLDVSLDLLLGTFCPVLQRARLKSQDYYYCFIKFRICIPIPSNNDQALIKIDEHG